MEETAIIDIPTEAVEADASGKVMAEVLLDFASWEDGTRALDVSAEKTAGVLLA